MVDSRVDRQARRKAATRTSILRAADRLFSAKGFAGTSIKEISREADVAVRTIYLHFDSKASILLAYFDNWLNDLVDHLCASACEKPSPGYLAAALREMKEAGWSDDRTFTEMARPHPLLESLDTGSLEIAGHVMQSWVRAQTRLADHFRETGSYGPTSIEPRVRAAAVFANWMATVLTFQDEFDGKVSTGLSTYEVSMAVNQVRLEN